MKISVIFLGCVGVIGALANVLGDECCKLYKLFEEEKGLSNAVSLQRTLISPNYLVKL